MWLRSATMDWFIYYYKCFWFVLMTAINGNQILVFWLLFSCLAVFLPGSE